MDETYNFAAMALWAIRKTINDIENEISETEKEIAKTELGVYIGDLRETLKAFKDEEAKTRDILVQAAIHTPKDLQWATKPKWVSSLVVNDKRRLILWLLENNRLDLIDIAEKDCIPVVKAQQKIRELDFASVVTSQSCSVNRIIELPEHIAAVLNSEEK